MSEVEGVFLMFLDHLSVLLLKILHKPTFYHGAIKEGNRQSRINFF